MKLALIIGAVIAVLFAFSWLTKDAQSKEPDIALWLARSCVGEAGFRSGDTGECAAIAHIYKKRGGHFYTTMRKYSGALKTHSKHTRPWLFDLNRAMRRPDGWPEHLKWSAYIDDWKKTLWVSDQFLAGNIPDPLPDAEHFGGWVDRHRVPKHWVRIPSGYRNRFYKMRTVK